MNLPEGFKEHTYIVVEYGTLDEYLKKEFPDVDPCVVSDYEMSNDSELVIDIHSEGFDEWDKEDFDKAIVGLPCNCFGGPTKLLMQYLCQLGKLPAGAYLVKVCW